MSKVIVISNDGLMDIEALRLMGVSSKREDHTKIGMFGTGMKYAIARMLKLNIPFEIWLGEKEIKVTTEAGNMRGQGYHKILIDGQATSITTDMGPQWEPWTIVREILSNARDEAMPEFYVIKRDEFVNPCDRTSFILNYEAFEQVWLNREKYFVNEREALHDSPTLRIYKKLGEGTRIYKNGILVKELDNKEDAFDYDLPTIELNEMREVRYDWRVEDEVLTGLTQHLKDEPMIKQWLLEVNTHLRMGKHAFESVTFPNEQWVNATITLNKTIVPVSELGPQFIADSNSLVLPNGVVSGLKGKVRTQQRPELQLTTEQQFVKDQALMMLYAAHFKVQHDIVLMDFGGSYSSKPDHEAKRILITPQALREIYMCVKELMTCELELRTTMKRDEYQFGNRAMEAFADIIFLNANPEPQTARSHEESSDSPPTGE